MPEYVEYAEYYDCDHVFSDDLAFYLDYARASGSPILELACGTGRVLIPLAQAGFHVYGVDLAPGMLDICRTNTADADLGERVHLYLQNMADFSLPRQDFGLCYVPVRSFMHLFTQADQIACLQRVWAHLRPGGLFIVDLYAPDLRKLAQDPDQRFQIRKEYDLPNGNHVIRRDRFVKVDQALQMNYSELRFEEYTPSGALLRQRTVPMVTRYTFRWELTLLLERAGFQVMDLFGDYDKRPFDGTGEIIAVARKPHG